MRAAHDLGVQVELLFLARQVYCSEWLLLAMRTGSRVLEGALDARGAKVSLALVTLCGQTQETHADEAVKLLRRFFSD